MKHFRDSFVGIYTHPYKRGFAVGIEREGWLGARLLLWKWEFSFNGRGIVPPAQDIEQMQRRKIAEVERQAAMLNNVLGSIGVSNWNYEQTT